jgi:hypothetical protein
MYNNNDDDHRFFKICAATKSPVRARERYLEVNGRYDYEHGPDDIDVVEVAEVPDEFCSEEPFVLYPRTDPVTEAMPIRSDAPAGADWHTVIYTVMSYDLYGDGTVALYAVTASVKRARAMYDKVDAMVGDKQLVELVRLPADYSSSDEYPLFWRDYARYKREPDTLSTNSSRFPSRGDDDGLWRPARDAKLFEARDIRPFLLSDRKYFLDRAKTA